MIAVLTNANDATADYFERRLLERGVEYVRINTELLPQIGLTHHIGGDWHDTGFVLEGRRLDLRQLSSIYYRRPRPPQVDDSSDPAASLWIANEYRKTWGGILASATWLKWVNHPLLISAANYKPEQLRRAMDHGLSVPETLITTDPLSAEEFCEKHEWMVAVKPIGHGELRGAAGDQDRLVYTNRFERGHAKLLTRVKSCPTLFQRHIDKVLDVRITVVEGMCVAVALHSQEKEVSRIDCRRNNMHDMRYSPHELPANLYQQLVALTDSYGLYFSAIDMAMDRDGKYWFFEINPAGQWAWLEQSAGASISGELIRCLTHSVDR